MKKCEFISTIGILILLLAACGQTTGESTTGPTESPLPATPVSPLSPLPTPQLELDTEAQKLPELRAQVAEQIGLADTALTLVSTEQITWPDASLGCPQPDMAYAQVLTPGWRVVFVDAAGKTYQVHATENHEHFIICKQPIETAAPSAYRDNLAVQAAIKALVKQEGVPAETVTVTDVAAVEWRNSCLGCEKPGQKCLMVITPGYRIVLESAAKTYTIHTDKTGRQAIICTRPSQTPPRSDS